MDVIIAAFFFLVSAILSIIGYAYRSPAVGGIGGIGLLITGLMLLTGGIDSVPAITQTQNFTAIDVYGYSWNYTFNSTTVNNVSTSFNKTLTQRYSFDNLTDNNTRTLSILIMFAGLAVMFDAFMKRRPDEE